MSILDEGFDSHETAELFSLLDELGSLVGHIPPEIKGMITAVVISEQPARTALEVMRSIAA